MNRPFALGLSVILLAVGIVLLVFGINANNSFGSQVSRAFSGSPTDRTMWFLVSGIVCAVLGLFGLLWGARKSS
jgi:hypothetical protein